MFVFYFYFNNNINDVIIYALRKIDLISPITKHNEIDSFFFSLHLNKKLKEKQMKIINFF